MRTTTRPDSDSRPTRERSRLDDVAPRRRPPLPAAEPHRDARRATAARHGVVALVVLIPAYQPDMRLTRLVRDVRRALPETRVLVVDDGSGPAYEGVLAAARAAGAVVTGYPVNAGKGEALRTGLARVIRLWPGADVVCADADGQHTPADIAAVARRVHETGRMTLGVRAFTGSVPLRSRLGNSVTALLFRGATGWRLRDTQTGLRGYPAGELEWLLEVPGDRYEYELSTLLRSHELGMAVEEIEIATVYEPGNASSHFRPLRDSARIYAPLLRFTGASLASFVIDWIGVVVLHLLTGSLLTSVVGARLISGAANFFMNRRVFRAAPGTVGRTAVRYVALALALVAASYLALAALTGSASRWASPRSWATARSTSPATWSSAGSCSVRRRERWDRAGAIPPGTAGGPPSRGWRHSRRAGRPEHGSVQSEPSVAGTPGGRGIPAGRTITSRSSMVFPAGGASRPAGPHPRLRESSPASVSGARSRLHPGGDGLGATRVETQILGAVLRGVGRIESGRGVVVEVGGQSVVVGFHGQVRLGPGPAAGLGHGGAQVDGLAHDDRRDLVVHPLPPVQGAGVDQDPLPQGVDAHDGLLHTGLPHPLAHVVGDGLHRGHLVLEGPGAHEF